MADAEDANEEAEADDPVRDYGLVGMGGDLSPARLLEAYARGIFPWYADDEPIMWWCPDPRAIIEIGAVHVSRSLTRTLRSGRFETTLDRDFVAVMRGCGERAEGTWITPTMLAAYTRLHELGHAHSLEVWQNGQLAGGIYGVTIGGFFAAESMFHRATDASKVALVLLLQHLARQGFTLFDIQFTTPHTLRMGATTVPRETYLERLAVAIVLPVRFA